MTAKTIQIHIIFLIKKKVLQGYIWGKASKGNVWSCGAASLWTKKLEHTSKPNSLAASTSSSSSSKYSLATAKTMLQIRGIAWKIEECAAVSEILECVVLTEGININVASVFSDMHGKNLHGEYLVLNNSSSGALGLQTRTRDYSQKTSQTLRIQPPPRLWSPQILQLVWRPDGALGSCWLSRIRLDWEGKYWEKKLMQSVITGQW